MSTPSFPNPALFPLSSRAWLMKHWKPLLAPYYLTIAALLGAATVGFLVVIGLLVLVATNFNLLGWME
jgi:hypothetical protein